MVFPVVLYSDLGTAIKPIGNEGDIRHFRAQKKRERLKLSALSLFSSFFLN